jgi:thiol:disulfide interchange protein DsbD
MRKLILFLGLVLATAHVWAAPLEDSGNLLDPDQAFSLSTRVVNPQMLEAKWKIADGYYMYRTKFKFQVLSGKTTLLDPKYPKGKIKNDPGFGKVEIYQHSVVVQLPLKRAGAAAETLKLRITGQGCNEPVGVCYPPITKDVSFQLPPVAGRVDSLQSLKQLVQPADEQNQFLPPDQAFGLDVSAADAHTLRAHFRVADGYHLYRDKLRFNLVGADGNPIPGVSLGKPKLPAGEIQNDPSFGKMVVYRHPFDVLLPVTSGAKAVAAVLQVRYQGCAEKGICYPPIDKQIQLTAGGGQLAVAGGETPVASSTPAPATTPSAPAKTVSAHKIWQAILGAFITGLLLTFTPCVLPMIPILSSIIVGQGGEKVTKLRGAGLAFTYVLGTSLTYTVAGAIAGATGEQLQAYFQNVWGIGIFSALLVLLALSMFGFYEIQMPSFIQSRLQERSSKIQGGSYIGVFILGLISALIVGACVSPLLIAALSVAIASKSSVLGALIMFSMSLGMGIVLVILGLGAGTLLPKAGAWMDRVKYFFGVLLLGVAIYLLGLLPQVPVLYLWSALLIVTAIYLGALEPVPAGGGGWRYFFKGIGVLLLIWGVLALIGAFAGNRDITRPISFGGAASMVSGTGQGAGSTASAEVFHRVKTVKALDAALAEAHAAGKPVVLDFYATWCTDCAILERTTFADPQVQSLLSQRFAAIQVDVSDPSNPDTQAIKKRFGIFGPPALLFMDANGKLRPDLAFYGIKSTKDFIAILNRV